MTIVASGAGSGFGGIPDQDNSTTVNLADGATFTGQWKKTPIGLGLLVTGYADQDVTVRIQYSIDGSTVRSNIPRYIRSNTQIEVPHKFLNAREYYRIVVENNSGSATTVLEVQATICDPAGILNIPTDATMSQDYDAISTRPTSFNDEVALGRRQGWELWNKFGYNQDVDTASAEIVASFGGVFARMTSADTLNVVSTSANDTSGGTGVNSVVIYGIDENRDPQIEVVTMNGTTPVTTTNQWFGVNRVAVFLFGSSETNAGDINVTATTAGSTQAQMPAGDGVTQQLIFHVPQKHTFLAEFLFFNINKLSGGGSPRVTIKGLVYSAVNQGVQEIYRKVVDTSVENTIVLEPASAFPVSEKTILYFTASTDTNNTVVTGRFSGKLVRNASA